MTELESMRAENERLRMVVEIAERKRDEVLKELEDERHRHDRLQDWDTALTAKYEEALAEIERLQSQLDLWRD